MKFFSCLCAVAIPVLSAFTPLSAATTAWSGKAFVVDVPGVVGRSDIVLERPNLLAREALPMGNGRLGVAVWSADGFTAQLNRADTLPRRLSPGQLSIPSLAVLTSAKDYKARLDLYNGTFEEQGAGVHLKAWVEADTDALVVDVTGLDPHAEQTAVLSLWPPRTPQVELRDEVGTLAETWKDNTEPGATGRPFGSLAAVSSAGLKNLSASKDTHAITLKFLPDERGHFTLRVAAPGYNGEGAGDARSIAVKSLTPVSADAHEAWWHRFWSRAGLIKVASSDGTGEYMESLRTLFLFTSAAQSGSEFPGSQAGLADMFSSVRDSHNWDPGAYWHWNLRMQVAANLGAGLPELNEPYFRLYRENLANIEAWTKEHMGGREGICVPETMRFNGPGYEFETWGMDKGGKGVIGLNCDAGSQPYYNARTISTGAEVGYWIWQQYLVTGDRKFLEENYPVMVAAARFLLSYEKPGPDGLNHTSPTNAHETQWDVKDSILDLCARKTLYKETLDAARLLHTDAELAAKLEDALKKIPPLPLTEAGKPVHVLSSEGADAVVADSYNPATENHNVENLGLEPVWPWGMITPDSPLFAVERQTFEHRPYPTKEDWSFDPIQAARLGLGKDVASTLVTLTEEYQQYPNGFANWGGEGGEFYIEQIGVVTTALDEALAQNVDGTIRIAPAIPPGWDIAGSVWVRGRTKVDVETHAGAITTAVIEAGTSGPLKVENPWRGQAVQLTVQGAHSARRVQLSGNVLTLPAEAGTSYVLAPEHAAAGQFAAVSGTSATTPKHLGKVALGLAAGN
ncbi:glycosyl hydrolase family 95 catalytic domain-containing protein [Silvibacterium sp.]|uniref:glycosyl hydrolase family 95 catalytic domain-containing protein n=1 Tax=Silvibacterium sp. TaxID=1964179 RepID=UPI0039E37D82